MTEPSRTVLIVDDSSLSRMLLKSLLLERRPDWVVLEAASGEQALEVADKQCPDLITLDINMPGMGGLAAAQRLKERCPAAQLAVMTANVQESVRQQVQSLGILFLAMVEKPITAAGVDKILFRLTA
ncbi:response regulator [Niveibacterium sp. SC-1]|uniref:response regulator transcription factor n=1 Tax=Niveibacterium sp. SC-1 TaxID=3135646 RepID=UPI00311E2378